jgi:hydrogenase maturation protein HypF
LFSALILPSLFIMKINSAKAIHIKGLVQGVGFRPFVYRLALENHISGWVENGNDGVRIHAEGSETDLNRFLVLLSEKAPAASQILEIISSVAEFKFYERFVIKKSEDYSEEITDISPDIAVCDDCLADMKTQSHRIDYPFINCTNCGPRFSIIRGLPYDRSKTTMDVFKMCPDCEKEYRSVEDRRFHAQPVACNQCGPEYQLIYQGNTIRGIDDILKTAAGLILAGHVLAVKGIGGFHLACDATNEAAVSLLRKRKYREGKPFAVMFRDIASCRNYMDINNVEENELKSWRKPIVILKNKKSTGKLAESVSNGFNTTGVMLPYMPVHYLLFERLAIPAIVFTSGNLSDEPVIIDNLEAVYRLEKVADAFLVYNRDIYNRTDDSVIMIAGNQPRLIRRSRGFAPAPVNLGINVDGIFAAGAELVNCFCLGKDRKALMSQHIGDLKNLETLQFYEESMSRYAELFRVKPQLVACDLHPDYLSTRFARDFAEKNGNLPLVEIQHHHAHIASCMAEHGLDERVIGVSMDGVGYGSDGHIWGFEVMLCDLLAFERMTHLEYVPQPGGDMANHEPWRMALAYLYQYVNHDIEKTGLPFLEDIPHESIMMIKTALVNKINTPLTSSAGRLFDAISAMTGLCTHADFHAEAPMRLENVLDPDEKGYYEFLTGETINPQPVITSIVHDIRHKVDASIISAKFHRGVVETIFMITKQLKEKTGIYKVVLSGGSFQNKFLLAETENRLQNAKFQVYTQRHFPANDGGIALGQLIIAAKRREFSGLNNLY